MAESHVRGGFYRRGDDVVDANGRVIENGPELADKMDKEAERKAKAIEKQRKEEQAAMAGGGLAELLRGVITPGSADSQVAEAKTGADEPLETKETKDRKGGTKLSVE